MKPLLSLPLACLFSILLFSCSDDKTESQQNVQSLREMASLKQGKCINKELSGFVKQSFSIKSVTLDTVVLYGKFNAADFAEKSSSRLIREIVLAKMAACLTQSQNLRFHIAYSQDSSYLDKYTYSNDSIMKISSLYAKNPIYAEFNRFAYDSISGMELYLFKSCIHYFNTSLEKKLQFNGDFIDLMDKCAIALFENDSTKANYYKGFLRAIGKMRRDMANDKVEHFENYNPGLIAHFVNDVKK